MFRNINIFLSFMLLTLSSPFSFGNTIVFTMENALHQAYKLKAQGIALEIYKKYEKKAYANYKPKVDVSVYQTMQKTEFTERPSSISHSTNYTLSLKQNLYNGYYDTHAIEMAHTDVSIHSTEYERIEQTIMYDAIMAHLSVLRSKDLLLMQKQLLSQYKSLLSIASKKAFYGDENEQIELQSRYYQAKLKYLELGETFDLNRLKYKRLTGMNSKKLKSDMKVHSALIVPPSRANLSQINPILLKNILEVEKADSQIKRDRSNFLPKVDIELKAYKAEPLAQLSYSTQNQYSATLNLNYNLYNAHRDKLDDEINQLQKIKLILEGDELNEDIIFKYGDFYTKYIYSYKSDKIIKKYILGEKKKYKKYKEIFKLSSDKSLLDLLSTLTNLYHAKELHISNKHGQMAYYNNLLLLQSKLSLDNFK